MAQRLERNILTVALAVRRATHPATRREISSAGDKSMEIGAGHHAETGSIKPPRGNTC